MDSGCDHWVWVLVFCFSVKRKFRLSHKSAIVANDRKVAYRVAKELANYGIYVQVCDSTRDVGVIFTAGVHREMSSSKTRLSKAKKRNARIIRVSSITRSARKKLRLVLTLRRHGDTSALVAPALRFCSLGAWLPPQLEFPVVPSAASPLAFSFASGVEEILYSVSSRS